MGSVPAWLLRHTVQVEPYTGEGTFGPEYGPAVDVTCFVEQKRRLVRGKTGAEVISEARFFAPLATDCPVDSRVTLPSGRQTTVLAVSDGDGGGLPTPDHVEVALQ